MFNTETELVIDQVLRKRYAQIVAGYRPDVDDDINAGGGLVTLARHKLNIVEFDTFSPGRIRAELVSAAALVVAEIERLDRAAAKNKTGA